MQSLEQSRFSFKSELLLFGVTALHLLCIACQSVVNYCIVCILCLLIVWLSLSIFRCNYLAVSDNQFTQFLFAQA